MLKQTRRLLSYIPIKRAEIETLDAASRNNKKFILSVPSTRKQYNVLKKTEQNKNIPK